MRPLLGKLLHTQGEGLFLVIDDGGRAPEYLVLGVGVRVRNAVLGLEDLGVVEEDCIGAAEGAATAG